MNQQQAALLKDRLRRILQKGLRSARSAIADLPAADYAALGEHFGIPDAKSEARMLLEIDQEVDRYLRNRANSNGS